MRVFVTGADGYLGALLCPELAAAGHEVVGLDTGYYREGWLYPARGPRPAMLTKDVRAVTAEDLAGCDAIAHLAELSNDPLGQQDPKLTFEINHAGSVRLAREAQKAGVRRFVYMSSCSVYGAGAGDGGFVDETTPPNPQTAYAECKALVERDVSAMTDARFAPCFLRNATAFGASPRMRFDIVLNDLCGLAFATGRIALKSDGSPWRPLVHARDIAQAVVLSLAAPLDRIAGRIFNVGATEQNYRVIEIARIVAEAFPGCDLSVGAADGDNRSYRVRFDRIGEVLPEFRCAYDAAAGARELRTLFEAIALDEATFRARPYTRLKMLLWLQARGLVGPDLRWAPGP